MVTDEIEYGLAEYDNKNDGDEDYTYTNSSSCSMTLCPKGKLLTDCPYRQCTGYKYACDFE